MKLNLDPYQNEDNWLTKKEVVDTKEEHFTDAQLIRDFDVSKPKFKSLLDGTLKKIKIGKRSPHFDYEICVDANPNNPLSRGGWLDTRDAKQVKQYENDFKHFSNRKQCMEKEIEN